MKRSGFARPQFVSAPASPIRPLARPANYASVPYTDGGRPKDPRIELPHLLEMARRPGQTCLLSAPVCPGGLRDDTCACHGNSALFGKGMGQKAHDFFTVRGCARCHTWLDTSYNATRDARQLVFRRGLLLQADEWLALSWDSSAPVPERREAALAIAYLRAKGFIS